MTQEAAYFGADAIRMNAGAFNTNNHYLVKTTSVLNGTAAFAIAAGPTMLLTTKTYVDLGGHTQESITWCMSINGYTQKRLYSEWANGDPTVSFAATVTMVNVL